MSGISLARPLVCCVHTVFGCKNAQFMPFELFITFLPFVPDDREGRPYISCRSEQATWADKSAVSAINRLLRGWALLRQGMGLCKNRTCTCRGEALVQN